MMKFAIDVFSAVNIKLCKSVVIVEDVFIFVSVVVLGFNWYYILW